MEAKTEIQIEVEEEREMTDAEVDSVAALLFGWWRREYEQETDERMQSKLEKQ